MPAAIPLATSSASAVHAASGWNRKKSIAIGKPGNADKIVLRYRGAGDTDRDSLEHDLLDDMCPRHADRAQHRDLSRPLVHRHRRQSRHKEKSDQQTHRTKYERELAKIAQSLID